MECGIAFRGKPGASTWDWASGGQTPPTGGVGLRAGRPWSVAREMIALATQVLCHDILTSGVQEQGLVGHGGHQNRLGLIGNRGGAGSRFAVRRRCLSVGLASLDRFGGYEWSVVAIEEACSIPNFSLLSFRNECSERARFGRSDISRVAQGFSWALVDRLSTMKYLLNNSFMSLLSC